ncbi:MAG: ABC transporter permease subunit [Acidobacteriota bacterium]
MNPQDSGRAPSFGTSFRNVFSFFFFLGRRTGRTRVFYLLGLIPVAIAVFVRIILAGRGDAVGGVFNEILMVFFVTFDIVIMTLFYGTSIVAEEVDGRTLPYLASRPLPKPAIFLGKYAACACLMILIVATSLLLSFFILNGQRLGEADLYLTFLRDLGVLVLGILAYTAFFAFLGSFLKRAIIIGLIFGFGCEYIIQYFPGSTQKFSLVHYMKSLLPRQPTGSGGGRLAILLFKLEPTKPAVAVLALLVITAVFLALGCWLFRAKEYLFEE